MAKNIINKYVWLVDTIYRARKISFDDISRHWMENDMSDGQELPKRTFHKWRIAAEDMFGISIDCEKHAPYRYFIYNESDLHGSGLRTWLLNTISVSNMLMENRGLKDRILLEAIPSGRHYLAAVIKAMKKSRMLLVSYQNYYQQSPKTVEAEPYCVKLFAQRWYMVANVPADGKMKIYSLDRMMDVKILSARPFDMPKDFSADDFFRSSYGIMVDDSVPVECKVVVKVYEEQVPYLRSLPLHHSQQETECNEAYSIFEYSNLRPTYDFQMKLLSMGEQVEVLAPAWLRDEMVRQVDSLWQNYHPQD